MLNIQDNYHGSDNKIQQFYYEQSVYKGNKLNTHKPILLKLTLILLTEQSAKEEDEHNNVQAMSIKM
jgi:hypothetical protein